MPRTGVDAVSLARSIFSIISRSRAAASTGLVEWCQSQAAATNPDGTHLAAPKGLGFVDVAEAGVASPDLGLPIGVFESPVGCPLGRRSNFRLVGGPLVPGRRHQSNTS